MADIIDAANDRAQNEADTALAAIRNHAANIPPGEAGECDFCGERTGRLVNGACAPCRDRRRLA